jgi:hypothetical protein
VTEREKLKREIYVLGQIIKANAVALASKSMNDEDRNCFNARWPHGRPIRSCCRSGWIVFRG